MIFIAITYFLLACWLVVFGCCIVMTICCSIYWGVCETGITIKLLVIFVCNFLVSRCLEQIFRKKTPSTIRSSANYQPSCCIDYSVFLRLFKSPGFKMVIPLALLQTRFSGIVTTVSSISTSSTSCSLRAPDAT